MPRIRISPRLRILAYVEAHPEGVTRSSVAAEIGRTYWSARYWLDRLESEGFIRSERIWTVRGFVRRVFYHPIIPIVVPPTEREALEKELRRVESVLERVRRRISLRYSLTDHAERAYLLNEIRRIKDEIEKLKPRWELVQATIAIYSLTDSPPPRPYKYRFQGFYEITALRNARTGEFSYDRPLTLKEIDICIGDFMARWNWIGVPKLTSEPLWIETSEFRFVDEPESAVLMSISKIDEGDEVYWRSPRDVLYTPNELEREAIMRESSEGTTRCGCPFKGRG